MSVPVGTSCVMSSIQRFDPLQFIEGFCSPISFPLDVCGHCFCNKLSQFPNPSLASMFQIPPWSRLAMSFKVYETCLIAIRRKYLYFPFPIYYMAIKKVIDIYFSAHMMFFNESYNLFKQYIYIDNLINCCSSFYEIPSKLFYDLR